MSKKNLPIKMVLQRTSDLQPNIGGGPPKLFCELTSELRDSIADKFEDVLSYYEDVFAESAFVPAVGRITVKPEAIAKSHKPNDLCRNCPIIGGEDLNEIYIKLTRETITETVALIKNPPSKKFDANLTAIADVQPIRAEEKISEGLSQISAQGSFDTVKKRIKVKVFDFDDAFDNDQIMSYIKKKLAKLKLDKELEVISYGEKIKYIRLSVSSYDDIIQIASVNGIKSVDFFQEFSLPLSNISAPDIGNFLDEVDYSDSEISIGIIDSGISDDNLFLKPYVAAREIYVGDEYRNCSHATFIASMIQYGNRLNDLAASEHRRFKFVDVVAIPNSDPKKGLVDTIGEQELMEIIEEVVEKYSPSTKIWNLSLGIESQICSGNMSDLGVFLDYIQDKYQVQFFVSSGNLRIPPLRAWPPQADMAERDRLVAPADSVRAITVGSLALHESSRSIVKTNEPSPFSRRGPGANFITKPDIVDYGGNYSTDFSIAGLGMKGMDARGSVVEANGTSFSNPRSAQKFASIYDEMVAKDLLLAKAMLIHSARMNSRDLLEQNSEYIKYYGFGMPAIDTQDILLCSENEITLVFKQKIVQGSHLELMNFPYPASLIRNGKCYGEIGMTLAYSPSLDNRFGKEYCRANIDVSFGTYKHDKNGEVVFKGCVPLESTWEEKFEQARVENGFKWSPIKSYYRKFVKGIEAGEGWKIRVDMTPRNGYSLPYQEFVLIISIKAPENVDIYTEVINGLRERGYTTNNLETRQQIRQRQ